MRRLALLPAVFLLGVPGFVLGQTRPRVVHVFVALADNAHQGIVPVPAALGNGDDPARNLYWGAQFGVRTFFKNSPEWKEPLYFRQASPSVLERSIFTAPGVVLIADAYRGTEIKRALTDFFHAAAGIPQPDSISGGAIVGGVIFQAPSVADLVVYVGHDGLMDFPLTVDFSGKSGTSRSAIVLACASRSFFKDLLKQSGATPLLWTNGLMAPEAYTLKAAVDGWIADESKEQIRTRAAAAYAKYQKISDQAALKLFATDW
jgi:hypothetical protein